MLGKSQELMLTKAQKQRVINKYKLHQNDTGSPQVQIALLSYEIKDLTGHLKEHKKDHSSRRGLLKKVGERRRLLKYLAKEDIKAYEKLVKQLKLKVAKVEEKDTEEPKAEELAKIEKAGIKA
jgi:small subunit ribosomal protein S15